MSAIADTTDVYETDAIFKYFQQHWTDDGSWPTDAWSWWFNGINPDQGNWNASQVYAAGGDFYRELDVLGYVQTELNPAKAMSAIDQFFHNGDGVALDIYSDNPSMAHAITAWGFTYNAALKPTDPNYYTGVYVTDSDDQELNANTRLDPNTLQYYQVKWDATNQRWYMEDYGADAGFPNHVVHISEVDGLEKKFPGVQAKQYTELGE